MRVITILLASSSMLVLVMSGGAAAKLTKSEKKKKETTTTTDTNKVLQLQHRTSRELYWHYGSADSDTSGGATIDNNEPVSTTTSIIQHALPTCPPEYNPQKTSYIMLESATINSELIFSCQDPQYCNIHIINPSWSIEQKQAWDNAWLYVEACTNTGQQEEDDDNEEDDTSQGDTPLPTCPTQYSPMSTTYKAGDKVEVNSHILLCQPDPYTEYCNEFRINNQWNTTQIDWWKHAWVVTGPCSKETPKPTSPPSPPPVLHTPEDSSPTRFPTKTPTENPTPLPFCPQMYDPTASNYVAGDQVTIHQGMSSHIYECAGGEYKTEIERTALVAFCNIVSDDALTEEEKQLWDVAWKRASACYYKTDSPTRLPTKKPITMEPSRFPTQQPLKPRTPRPSTTRPSPRPITMEPTRFPTQQPFKPRTPRPSTTRPSPRPSKSPSTFRPTYAPSNRPTTLAPIGHLWWPDIETNEKDCKYGSDYPQWMTLNSNRHNFLFESRDECCVKHSCAIIKKPDKYWYPDIESSEKQCTSGTNYPQWMTIQSNKPHFLFQSLQECCLEHGPCSNVHWYPDVYTNEKRCIFSNEAPYWMTIRASHYLFETEKECCTVHQCETQYYYPNLMLNTGKRECIRNANFPEWMGTDSNAPIFLFDSEAECCANHGCDAADTTSSHHNDYSTSSPSPYPTRKEASLRPSRQPTSRPSRRQTQRPSRQPSMTPTLPQILPTCPDRYDSTIASTYKGGTRVDVGSVIYQCKGSLYSYYCGQATYKPQSRSTALWATAWEDLGPCTRD